MWDKTYDTYVLCARNKIYIQENPDKPSAPTVGPPPVSPRLSGAHSDHCVHSLAMGRVLHHSSPANSSHPKGWSGLHPLRSSAAIALAVLNCGNYSFHSGTNYSC